MAEREELDDLFGGESDSIEYKVARPKDSMKYMKTVVAFANGRGGKIVFGVDDGTLKVVGVPLKIIFGECDAIANAISDSCAPTIAPRIYKQSTDGKTCIVVDVPAGNQVPYYIKSLGFEKGVFIRVGATSRPADFDHVRMLMAENSPRGFDRTPMRAAKLRDGGVADLCGRMREVAVEHARSDEERRQVREVTESSS